LKQRRAEMEGSPRKYNQTAQGKKVVAKGGGRNDEKPVRRSRHPGQKAIGGGESQRGECLWSKKEAEGNHMRRR